MLKMPGAHRAEQSGIKGVKIPFDPNMMLKGTVNAAALSVQGIYND